MDNENTWEQPYTMNNKTEPVQSFEAFKLWVEMGEKRSLKAVAERLEKSHDTIKKYSCTWKWSERLQDKLTHESKRVYAKQLETVLTGLEADAKRDVMLQMSMGSIMGVIFELSLASIDKLYSQTNMKTGGLKENQYIKLLEQLTKIYSQMEKTHKDNQQKIIEYNHKCLSVQSFQSTNDYVDLIKNGKKQSGKFLENQAKVLEEQHENNSDNISGLHILYSDLLQPYTARSNIQEVDTEEPEAIPEPEAEQEK